MAMSKGMRRTAIALVVLVVLVIGGMMSFRIAVQTLKDKIVAALGPQSTIAAIEVGLKGVDVRELSIKSPEDWPAPDTLRAREVSVVPSLRSLFSGPYRIHAITVSEPYLSVLRTHQGKLRIIPSLLEKGTPSQPAPPVNIDDITLKNGTIELHDNSLHPHVTLRLEDIQAEVHDIQTPDLASRSRFDLAGTLKGKHQDGTIHITGWAAIKTLDASIQLRLRTVDLRTLQPYLQSSTDVAIEQGTLDLDLQAEIRDHSIKAPGTITLADLKLAPATGIKGAFLGVPRDSALELLKDKNNRITLAFTIQGDLRNPKFSLNEAISTRLANAMSDSVTSTLGGIAGKAGDLGKKGVESATEAVKDVGKGIKNLFGK